VPKSLVFKELLLQSILKTILSTPELARAGSFGGAGFGLAPCFYYMGRVKRFGVICVFGKPQDSFGFVQKWGILARQPAH
jgi:hypothetical protein